MGGDRKTEPQSNNDSLSDNDPLSDNDNTVNSQWIHIRKDLRDEVGDAAFKSWLKPLTLEGVRAGVVRLSLPTGFLRDWVEENYGERLRVMWQDGRPSVRGIEIVVTAAGPGGQRLDPAPGTPLPASARAAAGPGAAEMGPEPADDGDSRVSGAIDPRLTFENFVVGKPNELAYAAAVNASEAEVPPFNPLFIYGGVGLGKTHLMHAIAWRARARNPNRRVMYLSAEKFMFEFVRALRYKDTVAFKDRFRSVDMLMIDDVQFISGKDNTQEEFFHTFNELIDRNRQVVISSDKSPSDLDGLQERLRSRLGWGLAADILPTTYELRLSILQAKADGKGVEVPIDVLEFLAHRITANVRELEGALNRIVAHATLLGRDITVETTQEVLQALLRASGRRLTIEEIQKRVAEHFSMPLREMHSIRRSQNIVRPRQVAMYLAKELTECSYPQIARKFGGRDHTTVMHAVKRIEELQALDGNLADDIRLLRRMLEN